MNVTVPEANPVATRRLVSRAADTSRRHRLPDLSHGSAAAGVLTAVAIVGGPRLLAVIAVLIGVGLSIAGVFSPRLGLIGVTLLAVCEPLSRHYLAVGFGGPLPWNTVEYLLVGLLLARLPAFLMLSGVHTRLLQALLIVMGVQLVESMDAASGVQHLLDGAAYFSFAVFLALTKDDSRSWQANALVSGTFASIAGLALFIRPHEVASFNHNDLSQVFVTALFAICLSIANRATPSSAQSLGVLGALCVVWSFLSGSRGAFILASFAAFFVVVVGYKTRGRIAHIAVPVFIAALMATQFSDVQSNAGERLARLLSDQQTADSSTVLRIDLARGAWRLFSENPAGSGTGAFIAALTASEHTPGRELRSHSAWLKTLVENGIVGIALLAMFVFSFFNSGIRKGLPIGILAGVSLFAGFGSSEFEHKGLWLIAAGAGVLATRHSELLQADLSEHPRTSASGHRSPRTQR